MHFTLRHSAAMAAIAAALVAATGCATTATSSDVRPLSDGLNVVSKSGRVSWDAVTELQKEGARHAERFCGEQQRKAKIVDVKGFPAGMFDRSTRVETVFACEPLNG